jgi:hypothetical protein
VQLDLRELGDISDWDGTGSNAGTQARSQWVYKHRYIMSSVFYFLSQAYLIPTVAVARIQLGQRLPYGAIGKANVNGSSATALHTPESPPKRHCNPRLMILKHLDS